MRGFTAPARFDDRVQRDRFVRIRRSPEYEQKCLFFFGALSYEYDVYHSA